MQSTVSHGSVRGVVVKWPPSRTLFAEIRHTIHENAKWTLVVVGLSLVGTFLAMNVHYAGNALSSIIEGAFITLLSSQ